MILATSTGGTILITVVAFMVLLLLLVALLLFTKEKTITFWPGNDNYQWRKENTGSIW